MSNTIGRRSTSKSGCGSLTATWCRAAPTHRRAPTSLADLAQRRAAGEQHARRRDRARGRLDAGDAPASAARGRGAESQERTALAERHARRLHRERVRAHVPRRIDVSVGRDVAAAAMAAGRERRVQPARLAGVDPPHVEAGLPLHRHALAAGALLGRGGGEDDVAELAEAGVGAEQPPAGRGRSRRSTARAPPSPACHPAGGPRPPRATTRPAPPAPAPGPRPGPRRRWPRTSSPTRRPSRRRPPRGRPSPASPRVHPPVVGSSGGRSVGK